MGLSMVEKRLLIDKQNKVLSIRKQCELLGLTRSNFYYRAAEESCENIQLMRLLDEEFTRHPCKGVISMTSYLADLGYRVNPKRVRRLLRQMGIMAIYPKKNISQSHPAHKKYPYLLNDIEIIKPNQVWCTDITYIRLRQGFIYLVAIMDWYSRYVLSWRLSNALESSFCIEALEDALLRFGCPDIFNSDQGVQFTSDAFTGLLHANHIRISMDGRGRAFDNIFIERLWRSVKYEEVYLKDYADLPEAKAGVASYFDFYNYERHHQSLGNKKPAEIYFNRTYGLRQVDAIKNDIKIAYPANRDICLNTQIRENDKLKKCLIFH